MTHSVDKRRILGTNIRTKIRSQTHTFASPQNSGFRFYGMVAGVYGTLAYLDVKAGIPSSDGSQLPERATLSQSWYLTPTIISEGIKATWNALDDIAIISILVNTAMWLPPARRLLGRSGLRGLRTFQVSRHSWSYGAKQAAYEGVLLVLFLPGVIHYFDGDVFHFAAFANSVLLITACLGVFALRYKSIPVENLSIAPRNIISAIIGVYCVTYATERIWIPPALIFRLEPWSILLAHVFYCGLKMARGPMLARIAYLVLHRPSNAIEHMLTPSRRFCSVLCLAAHMPYST
jgi:hypothetical protein